MGGGKVWVTDRKGAVWRIEPGPRPITRSIAVGPGVTYVAYGAGAAWAGNYIDGTVSRIDARTSEVTRVAVGAVQALAAGAGGAWVSTAGRPRAGTLPGRSAGARLGGGKPDVLIASPPRRAGTAPPARSMADAIRLVLSSGTSGGQYTRLPLLRQSPRRPRLRAARCAANATAYARAERSWR